MQVKILAESKCQIVGVVSGDVCAAEAFLTQGEESTSGSRSGLMGMLKHVAQEGLQSMPAAWSHQVNKKDQIYEFVKGPLRLFYFKGEGSQIVVCTSGILKKTQKVDKASVARAAEARKQYMAAHAAGQIEVVE